MATNINAMIASYNIVPLIAWDRKHFSGYDLIKWCLNNSTGVICLDKIKEVTAPVCHQLP